MGLKRDASIDRYLCEAMMRAYGKLMERAYSRGEITREQFEQICTDFERNATSVKTVGRENPAPVVAPDGPSAEDQGF